MKHAIAFPLLAAVACGGHPAATVAANHPVAGPIDAKPKPPPPPPEGPDAGPPASPPLTVPTFAEVDADLATTYPLRAKLRRAGPLYFGHDAAPASPGSGNAVLLTLTAIDGDVGGSPRRPRLLCEEASARVAAYVDADELATVAQDGAVLVATRTLPATVDASTPGVHLAAGTEVALPGAGQPAAAPTVGGAGATATVAASYAGVFLHADGFVARDKVDVVYAEVAAPEPASHDAELVRASWLTDHPGGTRLAHLGKAKDVGNLVLVHRLGKPSKGFVLIRYDEDDGAAYAIGWVPERALGPYTGSDSTGYGEGHGGGLSNLEKVTLARGTLLTDEPSGAVVGVVTAAAPFDCHGDCAGDHPMVSLDACGSTVTVRARAR